MNNIIKIIIVLLLITSAKIHAQSIKAYYTNLGDNYGVLDIEQENLFGKYADIVVDIEGKGQVHFSRKTSYLPVWVARGKEWKFKEIVERSGDGTKERPDVLSRYSHVRLISSDNYKAVVHWRYFPNFNNVEWDGVVDEYFTITPDGKVSREIRKGTKRIDEWNDDSKVIRAAYSLNNSGILEFIRSNYASSTASASAVSITSKPDKPDDNLLLSISFNQPELLKANQVLEEVSSEKYEVAGHKTLVKKGVKGNAIHFDGYYSAVSIPNKFPEEVNEITIEAWIALGAYPFGPAPIVHQSVWGKDGFYLGIGENGSPELHITVDGNWGTVTSEDKLELFRWYYIAGTFNSSTGKAAIYIDGKEANAVELNSENLSIPDVDLKIGLNSQLMPDIEGRIRRGKWPSMFGIDGLIDEVKIYDRALSSDEINNIYISEEMDNVYTTGPKLTMEQINNPDMQERLMPVNPDNRKADKFGAKYTKLDYYESWDNLWRVGKHTDVVVSFDEMPVNITSWRGISYGLYYVTENGRWIGDQSNEDYRQIEEPGEAEGCLEHMSDKQCRHAHIRIIENTDARVLLHWRYGLVDSRYIFSPHNGGWGGWTDEYWSIYPDGVAVRDVKRGIVFDDGWVETMFLSAPGTKPEDNTELEAFTIINDDEEKINLSWADGMPEGVFENVQLTMVNSKSDYRMYNVFPTGSSVEVFGGQARRSAFHWWNHWPVSQITSDGRGARAADRMAHSSLVWGAPTKHMLMYGITNKPLEEMSVLARSWNSPPEVKDQAGNIAEYDQGQRAYIIDIGKNNLQLNIKASKESPLYNPCFIIKKWNSENKAKILLDGREVEESSDFRQGSTYDTDGSLMKIIWLKLNSSNPVDVEILQ